MEEKRKLKEGLSRTINFNVKFTDKEMKLLDKTLREIRGSKHSAVMYLVDFYNKFKNEDK